MTLNYQDPQPSTTTTHDHIYTTLLGVLGFLLMFGMLSIAFVLKVSARNSESRAALWMVLAMEGLFLAAIIFGLVIRLAFPSYRRWPTLGLNIILLFIMPPFGTALAIYGFLKIDKKLSQSTS